MHSRSAQNCVLFSQLREHGFRCRWTGLYKMALHELIAVCSLDEDVDTFQEGVEFMFQNPYVYYSDDLARYLLQSAYPNPPSDAGNEKKYLLLFGLFKEHDFEMFATKLAFRDVTHEILNICAKSCDVSKVARNVLLKIATYSVVRDEARDEYQAAISYLTEHRGVNVNDLDLRDFSILIRCLHNNLLHLTSVFSTPTTNVFLHTKLNTKKINLIWTHVLECLPSNLCPGSADVIRSFIRNGFDVKDALFKMDFSNIRIGYNCLQGQERFDDLLEILEIFMDHGARLNPLPGSNEEPFLHGVLQVYNQVFFDCDTCPEVYEFVVKCIQRGVDPKAKATSGMYEDLFSAVCDSYDSNEKDRLIEYLCDIGADANLHGDNGTDIWSRLCQSSPLKLASPRFNETLLNLLRRGLRTDCIDEHGNNVLHLYLHLYAYNFEFEGCCPTGLLCALDDLKFWDVLDALLDTGVPVSQVNHEREIPLDLLKLIIRCEDDLESYCSKCSQRYLMEPPSFDSGISAQGIASIYVPSIDLAKETPSTAADLKARVAKARKCMERFSPSSHQSM